jgi:hypothetical protein
MAKQQRAEGKLRELTNKRDAMENVARSKVNFVMCQLCRTEADWEKFR